MRVLVVKTSSLGDVIHTLPALTDAARIYPDIEFDWIVEEPFKMIPAWHRNVKRVIPIAFRRWRKEWFKAFLSGEMLQSLKNIRAESYDLVIDAQGLLKSALLSCSTRGPLKGYSWTSAREPISSIFYRGRAIASWSDHAVVRLRSLFAQSLGYSYRDDTPDYGIDENRLITERSHESYCVFLHGTTWDTKHWPEGYWIELGQHVAKAGYKIKLLWGNATEEARAKRIAASVSGASVLPKLGLNQIAELLAQARGIVSVDTGLGHLAAALGVPTISLYASTNPLLTGLMGPRQLHLSVEFPCSPCFKRTCIYPNNSSNDNSNATSNMNNNINIKSIGNKTPVFPPCFSSLSPEFVWQQFQNHMKIA